MNVTSKKITGLTFMAISPLLLLFSTAPTFAQKTGFSGTWKVNI
ncbi:MAG: hypothetical protein JWR09_3220, partial [Mucilaginibacter sp.]|nr:hypothetical protein [Mucilaginibacter sp.]